MSKELQNSNIKAALKCLTQCVWYFIWMPVIGWNVTHLCYTWMSPEYIKCHWDDKVHGRSSVKVFLTTDFFNKVSRSSVVLFPCLNTVHSMCSKLKKIHLKGKKKDFLRHLKKKPTDRPTSCAKFWGSKDLPTSRVLSGFARGAAPRSVRKWVNSVASASL